MVQDKNLQIIKQIVHQYLYGSSVMLFGSRAKGTFRKDSDYDVLVIIKDAMNADEKFSTRVNIRKELVKNKIYCDLLIQSKEDIKIKKTLPGNVIRYAMQDAIMI